MSVKYQAILFDLDMTLVDSTAASDARENARRRRVPWADVFRSIRDCVLYEGVRELLDRLDRDRIAWGVVTNTPSVYADYVLSHFEITPPVLRCYHDCRDERGKYLVKPHPAQLISAASELGCPVSACAYVGDQPNDIIAARAAKMISIVAFWGAVDTDDMASENPAFIFSAVSDLADHILNNCLVDA